MKISDCAKVFTFRRSACGLLSLGIIFGVLYQVHPLVFSLKLGPYTGLSKELHVAGSFLQKSHIPETLNLLTDADRSTDTEKKPQTYFFLDKTNFLNCVIGGQYQEYTLRPEVSTPPGSGCFGLTFVGAVDQNYF